MSLFCLVHGSTQDARCWDLLAPELERRGHRIVRAELPTDEAQADSSRYAQVILSCIPKTFDDVIRVAHSASGYFLPLVAAERRSHKSSQIDFTGIVVRSSTSPTSFCRNGSA